METTTDGKLGTTKTKITMENADVRDQPRNIEISQPMSPKRSLQVSTYLLLHRQGSVMRMMMKPGSMMNLVTGVGGE